MNHLISVALAGAIFTSASGGFVGLEIVDRTDQLGGDILNVGAFEVYVQFDHPDDKLLQVFNTVIQASGTFVHLPPRGGEDGAFPLTKQTYDNLGSALDSFVTIGFVYKGTAGNPDGPDSGTNGDLNMVQLTPGFCKDEFLTGDSISTCVGAPTGWFTPVSANNIQGRAGTYPDLKILLGRFVVSKSALGCADLTIESMSLSYAPAGGPAVGIDELVGFAEACTPMVDCNLNGENDLAEIAGNPLLDCNLDKVLDSCAGVAGDIDGDGLVNGADLGLLLAAWQSGECSADLNHDGTVDGADLGSLLAAWTG